MYKGQNLLQTLRNADASLNIPMNNMMGSDPNSLPQMNIRGTSSLPLSIKELNETTKQNVNTPLIIMDGFEISLTKLMDYNDEEIESITILKDASATAIYGSRGANGVIVVETKQPEPGKLKMTATAGITFEVPDLTSYDLLNARDKLELERMVGLYESDGKPTTTMEYEQLYKSRLKDVLSGVETDWMSKPLRTGIGQNYNVRLEGGRDEFRWGTSLSWKDTQGAMKGSSRRVFNGDITLMYTYKNLLFRNYTNISNTLSDESPYGSFSNYVQQQPYNKPYDENGNVIRYFDTTAGSSAQSQNPLYDAMLNTFDKSRTLGLINNFSIEWRILPELILRGQLGLSTTRGTSDLFYPASHTMFIEYDDNGFGDRKGQYTKTNGYTKDLSAQVGLNWNQTFLDKHSLFANFTWNIQSSESRSTTVMAEGFGNDNMDDISQATYYYRDSHPTGSDSKTREVGFIGALNYSYDDRYLLDASYRYSGSSMYGADNHWGGFWSVGAGWNIHNEHFFPEESIVKLLKLRWSLGYTGTQNFNPYQARATYEYGDIYYDGRLGTTIMGIPNTRLKWQRVFDSNYGFDLALGSFLTLRAEYYTQNTDNLLSDITLPPSAGFTTYKENLGEIQNKGVEVALSVTPWRNNEERGWLTFTFSAQHNKNTIKKIYDIFNQSNDAADDAINSDEPGYGSSDEDWNEYHLQTTRPATKYYEGCSMTAIWGVRSLGIDPMSGREMFLDKNGNPTFDYSTDDQVVIGDTNPKLRGNFGISGGWRGFTFSMTASYKLGGDLYNTTLVDRVENVSGFGNLDKRVAETWLNPGDHAKYRSITMGQSATDYQITKPTSRFVQSDDEIYFSSLSVGYEFTSVQYPWVNRIGMERLKLGFTANELARFSKVKVERGTSYPFARTFSFTLNASF